MKCWSSSGMSCLFGLLASTLGCADTLQLSSGSTVTETVTKYANNTFETRSADGKTASYSASNVRQILFDNSKATAQFKTRNYGLQEGTPVTFSNGAFTVTTDKGSKQFPLIFVERVAFVADRGQQVEVIGHGNQIDITKHLAAGNVTIVDFYADWCGPCKLISPALEQMAKTDPEIALRKIDIVNWGTPVVKQYNVHTIPQVNVYGRTGKLLGTVKGADVEQVRRYVAEAKRGG